MDGIVNPPGDCEMSYVAKKSSADFEFRGNCTRYANDLTEEITYTLLVYIDIGTT